GEEPLVLPAETALGSMARYITEADSKNFQPMNINFGLFPDLGERIRSKQERAERHANRALESIQNYMNSVTV
ncbi:methylenetetrahydrofolate--tRNA-(uracil(54)-C(5))-methyltransferase (FADH(2)-oxidizing) TrmFO, partial [Streptococcus pneumoniae]|nr:methylenetetrahydrofolate--tRNA-(uracil(54)-C(5))-methyltransferase (FADH(2)-oxidizing) TrmFO [Streptococcus pneumoniae]